MPKRKVTPKMLKANKQNAQKSTGPKTPEGKQRSAKNSIRHGLLAKPVFIENNPNEDPVEFESLLTALYHDYKPEGGHEVVLVQRIAAGYWRLRRAYYFETQSIQNERKENPDTNVILPNPQQLDLLIRYEGMIDRELNRLMTQLQRLQDKREEREQQEAQAEGQAQAKELFNRLITNNLSAPTRTAETKGESPTRPLAKSPPHSPRRNEPVKPTPHSRQGEALGRSTAEFRTPHSNNEPMPTPPNSPPAAHSSPALAPTRPVFSNPSPLK